MRTGTISRIFIIERSLRQPGVACADSAGRFVFLPNYPTQDLLLRLTIAFPQATRLTTADAQPLRWLRARGLTITTHRIAYLIEPRPVTESLPPQEHGLTRIQR